MFLNVYRNNKVIMTISADLLGAACRDKNTLILFTKTQPCDIYGTAKDLTEQDWERFFSQF